MCEDTYKPNKYTRHMSIEDWRRISVNGGSAKLIDPKYLNEPGDHPWRDEIAYRQNKG